jgi:hypothetical protein
MYQLYENSTDRHDQLVMMMWLGSAGAGAAVAFTVGLSYLGLL